VSNGCRQIEARLVKLVTALLDGCWFSLRSPVHLHQCLSRRRCCLPTLFAASLGAMAFNIRDRATTGRRVIASKLLQSSVTVSFAACRPAGRSVSDAFARPPHCHRQFPICAGHRSRRTNLHQSVTRRLVRRPIYRLCHLTFNRLQHLPDPQ